MAVEPEWISKNSLECILGKYYKDEHIQISNYTVSAAIPVGENFTSKLLRIAINFTTSGKECKITIITKCSPDSEMQLSYVRELKLFEQEIGIYSQIIPDINKLLENTPVRAESISAKCFHIEKGPQLALVLEDLTASGFKMYPREKGLDLQYCLLVVEKLAYFHATTAVLYEKDSTIIDKYNMGIFYRNDFCIKWIQTGCKALADACGNWEGCDKYSNKLKMIQPHIIERTFASRPPKKGDFNVLNHGDAWINNIMFSYDSDGKPHDLRFVDFQQCLYSSPVLDLHYFWAISPSPEVLAQHFETVLNHYYLKLSSLLKELQYPIEKIPSKEQIRNDFTARIYYGLASIITVLPVATAPKRKDATFDDLFTEDDSKDSFRYVVYNNERYKKYVEQLLPFYDKLGLFN